MKTRFLLLAIAFSGIVNAQTNYALSFNGSSDYVSLGTSAAANLRTIEFWFKLNSNVTSSTIPTSYAFIVRNDASQYHEFSVFICGSDITSTDVGRLCFSMRDNGFNHYVYSDNNSWSANTWYHVCGTLDPVAGLKLYINGALQVMTDASGTMPIPASGEVTTLGTWGSAMIRYFPGRLDEVRFWNRALSQNEIQQRMCYWLDPANETGLVGYWKMNEGSGSTIYDATTNNNGSIMGATFVQDPNCFTGTLGMAEIGKQTTISVFPNPFSSQTTLHSDQPFNEATLEIYNLLGQKVEELKNISGQDYQLKCENLKGGVYLMKVMEDDKIIATNKLIITD